MRRAKLRPAAAAPLENREPVAVEFVQGPLGDLQRRHDRDLLGGQLDFMFDSLLTSTPLVKAGKLRALAPDLVLNQSERLLRREVLSIPRLGFINRHASLLPRVRGRLAGFWSHRPVPEIT